VIRAPNRIFEESESRGDLSKEKSPLSFYKPQLPKSAFGLTDPTKEIKDIY
jgi:hypothetical protein